MIKLGLKGQIFYFTVYKANNFNENKSYAKFVAIIYLVVAILLFFFILFCYHKNGCCSFMTLTKECSFNWVLYNKIVWNSFFIIF